MPRLLCARIIQTATRFRCEPRASGSGSQSKQSRLGRVAQFTCALIATCTLAATSTVRAATPIPVIQSKGLTGTAPFAVHVHALNSTLNGGDQLSSQYKWDFGDSTGTYNTLDGWNAAHIYDQPGTYTITLTLTNQPGTSATVSATVTVNPDTRTRIYVSAAGNDANAGTSTAAPIKTLARAAQLLGDNRSILLRRGDHFSVNSELSITQKNVVLGAYGSGANPVLDWAGASNTSSGILGMSSAAQNVVIENLEFDSPSPISLSIVRGMQPAGSSITVRNCFFRDVSYALNCERNVDGLLVLNNSTGIVGAYFSWVQGSDHVYLGNTCPGSQSQHILRLGGCTRCLIASNTITNTANSTIWAMLGSYVYVANNILGSGRCIVGPNAAVGSPADRFSWAVLENNRISNEGFGTTAGAEHVIIRNNIVLRDGASCITIDGYLASMNRTSSDVRVVNNTGINNDSAGRFINIGTDVTGVVVANNMYSARNLQTGSYQSANVFLLDGDMNGVTFKNNLWSNPAATLWGNGWHYYWPYWSDVNGYKTPTQWAGNSQVSGESYRTFKSTDFDANYKPTFNASMSSNMAGVFTDCYGNRRPSSGSWTSGAVELNPESGGGGTGTPPVNADVTANGVVDIDDMLEVLRSWGACPGSPLICRADIDHNGVVNIQDFLLVLAAWN